MSFTFPTNRDPVLGVSVVGPGTLTNANNPSIAALDGTGMTLRMAYTAYKNGLPKNKPGHAYSSDYGRTWSPAPRLPTGTPGTSPSMMTLTPTWGDLNTGDDINGTNALYFENGIYHLYWKGSSFPVDHATSTNGIDFIAQAQMYNGASGGCYGINDAKKINGSYLWLFHCNTNTVWFQKSTNVSSWPSVIPAPLFDTLADYPNLGSDKFVVSAGAVTDGARLYGVIYGAGSGPLPTDLWRNSIFARWLQKKATFSSSFVNIDKTMSFGPDMTVLNVASSLSVETGVLKIYDTDGTTLLYTSPPITFRAGDTWKYIP